MPSVQSRIRSNRGEEKEEEKTRTRPRRVTNHFQQKSNAHLRFFAGNKRDAILAALELLVADQWPDVDGHLDAALLGRSFHGSDSNRNDRSSHDAAATQPRHKRQPPTKWAQDSDFEPGSTISHLLQSKKEPRETEAPGRESEITLPDSSLSDEKEDSNGECKKGKKM